MTTNELLDLYPVATEVVRDWFMDKMAESFKNQELPKDFKEFMREQGIPNDKLVKLIDVNPRVLLDVFDANDIIINIRYTPDGFTWGYVEPNANELKDTTVYAFRPEAERAAVQRAFQILDDKLNVTLVEDNDA
jgi:hypothetical protein